MSDLLFDIRSTSRSTGLLSLPVESLFGCNRPEVACEHLIAITKILKIRPYPLVQSLSQLVNVIGNTLVPTDITSNTVHPAWLRPIHEKPSLLRSLKHRRALGQRIHNVGGKIWAEGNELHYCLRIEKSCSFRYLFVFPSSDLAIRSARHLNCAAHVRLLYKKVIGEHLREHLGLPLTPAVREVNRHYSNQKSYEDGKSCRDGRNRIPIQSARGGSAHFNNYAHSPISLPAFRHIATPKLPETVPVTISTVKPPRNRRTRLRPDTEHKDCSHG